MKILILGLLVLGFTLTQSTPVTKQIEKRIADNNPKLEDTSKFEKSKEVSSKINDSNLKASKITSAESKEDQKHNLKLEDVSDPKQVDRAKKSCKTLTTQQSIPTKFCMEIIGSPSTVTICDDGKINYGPGRPILPGSRPQVSPYSPQRPASSQPITDNLSYLPQNHLDISPSLPGYELVYPQSSFPLDLLISPLSPENHLDLHKLIPNLQVQPSSGQSPNIYLVSGNPDGLPSSYPGAPGSYPIGGLQPVNSGSYALGGSDYPSSGPGNYLVNGLPGISSNILIKGLPSGGPGVYPIGQSYPAIGVGSYSGGSPGTLYPGLQGGLPFTQCTCSQSSSGNIIVRPALYRSSTPVTNTSPRNIQHLQKLVNDALRPSHSPKLLSTSSNFGTVGFGTSANFGSLGYRSGANLGSADPGDLRDSSNSGGTLPGISAAVKAPGIDASAGIGIGHSINSGDIVKSETGGQNSQQLRYSQANDQPIQSLDVWGPLTVQGQRFSRGPDESTQDELAKESQKHLQTQNSQLSSQMMSPIQSQSSSSMLPMNPQKRSQNNPIHEKHNIDDEMVRNYQMQNPAMQQFMMERTRQHLHHENNPVTSGRYEEMDKITN